MERQTLPLHIFLRHKRETDTMEIFHFIAYALKLFFERSLY